MGRLCNFQLTVNRYTRDDFFIGKISIFQAFPESVQGSSGPLCGAGDRGAGGPAGGAGGRREAEVREGPPSTRRPGRDPPPAWPPRPIGPSGRRRCSVSRARCKELAMPSRFSHYQQYLARPGCRPYCSARPSGVRLTPFPGASFLLPEMVWAQLQRTDPGLSSVQRRCKVFIGPRPWRRAASSPSAAAASSRSRRWLPRAA